jgi:hypothetical protein
MGTLVASSVLPSQLHGQVAESQRELNGYLLGQHSSVLASTFGEPFREITREDGWTDRAYVLDYDRGVYMVFGFSPDRPEYMVAIQITGGSGIDMYPFLGLTLGDDSSVVRDGLGQPSDVAHSPELNLDVWTFDGRNYSVEFDSTGRLYSIRIVGFEGFPEVEGSLTPVGPLAQALRSEDIDQLLDLLAPDVEIYKDDSVHMFNRAARTELLDPNSEVSRLLYSGPGSLREVLPETLSDADYEMNLRIFERQPEAFYSVCKFPDAIPVEELVFQKQAGRWRVWEVRFR